MNILRLGVADPWIVGLKSQRLILQQQLGCQSLKAPIRLLEALDLNTGRNQLFRQRFGTHADSMIQARAGTTFGRLRSSAVDQI